MKISCFTAPPGSSSTVLFLSRKIVPCSLSGDAYSSQVMDLGQGNDLFIKAFGGLGLYASQTNVRYPLAISHAKL